MSDLSDMPTGPKKTILPMVNITTALSRDPFWSDGTPTALRCPTCQFEYQRWGQPRVVQGNDHYEAGWGGQGDLLVVPIKGECGHNWELCIGFHKGISGIFVRVAAPPSTADTDDNFQSQGS